MKKAVLALAAVLAVATVSGASTRIIPVAGHAPGGNGTKWITDLSLTNNSDSPAAVELRFYPEDGVMRSRLLVLGARQSQLIEDAVNPAAMSGTNPASWLGQLEIRSEAEIVASAHIHTAAKNGGTFGSTYSGVDPRVLPRSGAMTGLIVSNRYRSNVAFANPNDAAVTLEYTLRHEDGSVLFTRTVSIPAHATRQLPLADAVFTAGSDNRLFLTWTSSAPAYAVGSVIDNQSGDPTNAQSLAAGATSLTFPVAGKTPGSASTFWTTSVALSSTSNAAGQVTLVYTDNATGVAHTKTVDVAPHGTVKTDDLNDFLGAPMGTGSLRVDATARVVGAMRLFNTQPDGSTYGSAVLPQEPVVSAPKVRVSGVRRDEQYRLNVGVANDTATATGGTVRLFDDSGRLIESQAFHVQHGRAVQVPMTGTSAQVRSGAIEVETEQGVSVTVVASNIDNRSGDTVVRESEQENERQRGLDIVLSPRTGTVNVPITFSLGIPASEVRSASWDFGDGTTGSGLTPAHTYATAGEFIVGVTATLHNGATLREVEDVQVLGLGTGVGNGSPLGFTFSPAAPQPGQPVTFTASGATNGGTYKWKFPGDVRLFGSVVTFTFPAAGTFAVELELEHAAALVPEFRRFVTIGGGTNTNPGTGALNFTWSPVNPAVGQTVTFTAAGDTFGGRYKWKFPDDSRPLGRTATYTFTAAGIYEIELELDDESTLVPEVRRYVTVGNGSAENPPPQPGALDFTFTPSAPVAGQTVTFTAIGSANGGTFRWEFPGDVRRFGSTATFTFAAAGTYEVELELEHSGTTTRRVKKFVTVGGGGNPGTTPTSVDFSFSPASPSAGQTVTFTASSNAELPRGAYFKCKMPDDSRPTGTTVSYTFTRAGSYEVEVEIENVAGEIERRKIVVVQP